MFHQFSHLVQWMYLLKAIVGTALLACLVSLAVLAILGMTLAMDEVMPPEWMSGEESMRDAEGGVDAG